MVTDKAENMWKEDKNTRCGTAQKHLHMEAGIQAQKMFSGLFFENQ